MNNDQNMTNVIGPGAVVQNDAAPTPLLQGASELEFVSIFNPLSQDFAVLVAQDVPVNAPITIGHDMSGQTNQATITERDAQVTYGVGLRNKDFQGRRHIANTTVIRAGQTLRFKGNEAQVAVRQLVNEIIQRRGQSRLAADLNLRRQIEDEIVVGRGNIQELMDSSFSTPRQQAEEAIKRANEYAPESQSRPFAGLEQEDTGKAGDASANGSVTEEPANRVAKAKRTNS